MVIPPKLYFYSWNIRGGPRHVMQLLYVCYIVIHMHIPFLN